MRRRQKLSKKSSKRSFTKGAVRTHRKNIPSSAMRGGTRL